MLALRVQLEHSPDVDGRAVSGVPLRVERLDLRRGAGEELRGAEPHSADGIGAIGQGEHHVLWHDRRGATAGRGELAVVARRSYREDAGPTKGVAAYPVGARAAAGAEPSVSVTVVWPWLTMIVSAADVELAKFASPL